MSKRRDFTGSALVRLLDRLAALDAPAAPQAFADRLSQWLGWAEAISLAGALDGNGSAPGASPARAAPHTLDEASHECARLRDALASAIAEPPRNNGRDTRHPPLPPQDAPPPDFASYRRRYLARQQAMESGIAPLRARLRARLAERSAAMARLAAVDAVMERAIGARERVLLAGVPMRLEQRFEQLRRADDAAPTGEAPWLAAFERDLHDVLLAELDLRMQPVEGLLAALRTNLSPTT